MTAALIGLWSHLLAAALYGALALWQLRRWNGDSRARPLVAAFAVMSVWAIFLAFLGPYDWLTQLSESARNLAFLAFLYGLMQSGGDPSRTRGVKLVYAAVSGVVGLQIVVGGVLEEFADHDRVFAALTATGDLLGMIVAAGGLVLVHNLYGQADPRSRGTLQPAVLALAGMWAYDLHLYTMASLTREPAETLFAWRGVAIALLVPLFALAARRNAGWKVRLSRAATFQSLSLLAILFYLVLMMSASRAMEAAGGDWTQLAQIGLIGAMTAAALILLPSRRARAWLGVITVKHFFEHRYDYREEWLRFTDTIGRGGEDRAPIEERTVQALAELAGSEAGLLLLADDAGRLSPAARWNWAGAIEPSRDDDGELGRFLEATGHVVDFHAIADGLVRFGDTAVPVPGWIAALPEAWAGLPLIHRARLLGLVVLRHPPVRRALDWEDFDLFRTAGTQAASYLAEARGQQALAEAQRFDEFNRRFAFILHDIKNVVSQLTLVARNAERHADNPEFRADMVATLQSSVKKMNDLLARLAPASGRGAEPARPVALDDLLAPWNNARGRSHPVELSGEEGLVARADPAGLEQALAHLVQNAIDASDPGQPVRIHAGSRRGEVAIEVADTGRGMSAEFVRTRLFQPFASTKENGFGIGAYEARSLVAAMGGRLEVDSREGVGSRFTILLPRAAAATAPQPERIPA